MKSLFKNKIVLFLCIFAAIALFAERTIFFKQGFLERWSANITYPFLVTSHFISKPFRYFSSERKSYKDMAVRYKQLEVERDDAISENIQLKSLIKYDELTKDLREFRDRYKLENSILSKVLIRTFSSEEHSFIINRGSRDGVKKNMVAVYKFQLLGKVTDVFANHSKVLLITDSYCKIAAFTNSSNASGIVQGCNKLNHCQLAYVSHLEKIYTDDFVISSGKGLVFPEGFCLGKVVTFETKDVCHYVDLQPLIDFKTIKTCLLTDIEKINLF